MNSSQCGTGGYEWLTITVSIIKLAFAGTLPLYLRKAGAIVSIQIQLLTSSSMASSTPALIFLFLGITSELVGVIVVVYFARFPANPRGNTNRSTMMIMRGVSEVPTVLILIGIICLAAALVVEMVDISIGTAVAMSGVVFLGVFFCLFAWWVGISGRAAAPDQM
jgi:hypothetical protein